MVGACQKSSRSWPPPPRCPVEADVPDVAVEPAAGEPLAAGDDDDEVAVDPPTDEPEVVDVEDVVELPPPQAASSVAMAGALNPSATPRFRT